jgi:hypothetical protein
MVKDIDKFLNATLDNNRYYNFSLLPFDYISFIQNDEIINQVKLIHDAKEENKEKAKNKLQEIIYTHLYELKKLTIADMKDYFQKAILTDKFKTYLGTSFKYSIQYNQDENPYKTTFIHLAQLYVAELCYEYLWRLDHNHAI